jgi:hypothetical protein
MSVVYNCCWFSPAQSFSGPSPMGFMTTFYTLRFETPLTWRAKSPYLHPPVREWPSYTPRNWVSFSSSPTSRRIKVVKKSSIFWDITPWSPLKVTDVSEEHNTCFTLVCSLAYSSTLKMEATCSSKTSVGYQCLHGVIPQKTKPLFHLFVPYEINICFLENTIYIFTPLPGALVFLLYNMKTES